MAGWTADELRRIGETEEVDVAAADRDGTWHNRVTIWLVRVRDDLYVRSAVRGSKAAWYRAVQHTHRGMLWSGSLYKEVAFVDSDADLNDKIDAAYRSKYRRYAGQILNSCLTDEARATTMRLDPR